MKSVCAVYAIMAEEDRMIYVGSSKDVRKRFSHHKSTFRSNKHYTKELQEVWNKGEDYVKFYILEECEDETNLAIMEECLIEYFKKEDWNVLNRNRTFQRYELSPEIKAKLSDLQKGENNGNARLKETDIIAIRKLIDDGMKYDEIAEKYGVSSSLICEIKNKKKWKHVS